MLGVRAAAEKLGVHENTLRRWEQKGLIRAVKLPTGVRRFRAEDVEELHREMYDDFARAALESADDEVVYEQKR
jgi:excisionase family DNA binding protein